MDPTDLRPGARLSVECVCCSAASGAVSPLVAREEQWRTFFTRDRVKALDPGVHLRRQPLHATSAGLAPVEKETIPGS
ncbi:hypothetical protein MESS4_430017 [Mesorhizobium sp. STM 4661]|nr:hypothetical protein MESS4_430017 [Mesorhizobium sp. STM 4661]